MRIDRNLTSPLMPGKKLPKIRWLAWIILCALSVFFTEVVSGRTPAAFINIFGLFVTTPLYFLQLMVLLPFVFRTGKPGKGTLYLAGALFGLYEAYITKMIWSPTDFPVDLYVGGVAVCSTLMLVLFWHPVMSWILPLFAADGLLNSQRDFKIKLPTRWLNRLVKPVLLFAIAGGIMGLIHGAAVAEPAPALFSAVSSTLIIWVLLSVWKRLTGKNVFTLSQLLPNTRQWKTFVFLLAADYLVLGFVIRPDAFPPLAGHVITLVMYLVIGGLLLLSHREDKKTVFQAVEEQTLPSDVKISSRNWLVFSGGFVVLSFVASMLQQWSREGIHYIVWGLGIAVGLVIFTWVTVRLIQKMDIHIQLPYIRGVFKTKREKMNPVEQFDYAQVIRRAQAGVQKTRFDFGALWKKIVSLRRAGGFHRAQR